MTSTSVEFYTQQMDSARNSWTSVTTSKKYVIFLEETCLNDTIFLFTRDEQNHATDSVLF